MGGGTALMLQIDHRDSRDIDFFLPDPQLLGFVTAAVADIEAWLPGAKYRGDGSLFLKVAFEGVGEIDFIAAAPVTDVCPVERTIQGRKLLLDAVPAIIASKVHYRGSHLKVRDIFDIAASCEAGYLAEVREALAAMPASVATALDRLDKLPLGRLAELMPRADVRPGFEHLLKTAPTIAQQVLTLEPGSFAEVNEAVSKAKNDEGPDGSAGSFRSGTTSN